MAEPVVREVNIPIVSRVCGELSRSVNQHDCGGITAPLSGPLKRPSSTLKRPSSTLGWPLAKYFVVGNIVSHLRITSAGANNDK